MSVCLSRENSPNGAQGVVLPMAGKDCKPAFELQSKGGTKLLIIMPYDVRNSTLQSAKAPFRLKQQPQVDTEDKEG